MRSHGFTLAEVMVALAISGVLLGAIASVFVLQARAMPDGTGGMSASNQAARALERFSYDLSRAKFVSSATAARCEMVISDCTGDGVDDIVVYTWSAGGNWTRVLNGGGSEAVCENVASLSMSWRVRTVAAPSTVRTVEGVGISLSGTNARSRVVTASCRALCHARLP